MEYPKISNLYQDKFLWIANSRVHRLSKSFSSLLLQWWKMGLELWLKLEYNFSIIASFWSCSI